jgi:hypothetical protein
LSVQVFGLHQQREALVEAELIELGVLRLVLPGLGHGPEAHLVELIDGRLMQHGCLSFQW